MNPQTERKKSDLREIMNLPMKMMMTLTNEDDDEYTSEQELF
jgi:hypothetical protein